MTAEGTVPVHSVLSIKKLPLSSVVIFRLAGPEEQRLELRHGGLGQCSAFGR